MIRTINFNGNIIEYNLQQKNVKNINIRIKSNGSIFVSANKYVSVESIENFLKLKADFIINTLSRFEQITQHAKKQYYDEAELKVLIKTLCRDIYPYFREKGVKYPEIKFRKMVSQWGNCRKEKGILTFNTNLMYAPFECIEYVVFHEFTHLLQPNHSSAFYNELAKICPDWKMHRKKLSEISLRDK